MATLRIVDPVEPFTGWTQEALAAVVTAIGSVVGAAEKMGEGLAKVFNDASKAVNNFAKTATFGEAIGGFFTRALMVRRQAFRRARRPEKRSRAVESAKQKGDHHDAQ
jgi:hypothetical protein